MHTNAQSSLSEKIKYLVCDHSPSEKTRLNRLHSYDITSIKTRNTCTENILQTHSQSPQERSWLAPQVPPDYHQYRAGIAGHNFVMLLI